MSRRHRPVNRITGDDGVRYLRVSDASQVETDFDPEGNSIPAQRVAIMRRERELNSANVKEFIDPGRSGRSIEQRPDFQDMIAYLKANPNVRYVFVYSLSRFARDLHDDTTMMMHLDRLGVTLVSAMERNLDDTAAGRALHGMLAVFNQYESDKSAEDISYKMGQKVLAHGGTIFKAPIGYKNVTVEFETRRVNDVAVDEDRRGFIRDAFELYGTGEYTEHTLHDLLVARGFTYPKTLKRPERPVSLTTIGKLLRSRYYLGEVHYKGVWHRGRHEAIITPELFDAVQRVLDSHSGSGVRTRKYNHYLKGLFWCARCDHRLVFQPANGNGGMYYYFVCSGRIRKICDQPYVLVDHMEGVLERYYVRVHLSREFRGRVAGAIDGTLSDEHDIERRLRTQITRRLKELDQLEDRYVDQLGNPEWPQEKLRAKVAAIRHEREGLTTQLGQVEVGLEAGRDLLLQAVELLRRPQALYRELPKPERRVLTQTIFDKLMVDAREIVDHRLREPFDGLVDVQRRLDEAQQGRGVEAARSIVGRHLARLTRAARPATGGEGQARQCWDDLTDADLLGAALCVPGSQKELMVEAPGIEPGSEAASHGTSTSVVPVLVSPEWRPGTRLHSRPASVGVPPGAEVPPGGEAAGISVGSGPRGRGDGRRQAEA